MEWRRWACSIFHIEDVLRRVDAYLNDFSRILSRLRMLRYTYDIHMIQYELAKYPDHINVVIVSPQLPKTTQHLSPIFQASYRPNLALVPSATGLPLQGRASSNGSFRQHHRPSRCIRLPCLPFTTDVGPLKRRCKQSHRKRLLHAQILSAGA